MEIKYPIVNKIRPGHICVYKGKKNNSVGLIYGKEYIVVNRLPQIIVFSTKDHVAIDFGINDGGEYFIDNWEILNEEGMMDFPDFDYEKEKNYIYYDMFQVNSRAK